MTDAIAPLREFVGNGAATGAGADHDHDGVIFKLVLPCHQGFSGSQSMSPAPR